MVNNRKFKSESALESRTHMPPVFSDDLMVIKYKKGRGRLELYVHNEVFAAQLHQVVLHVFSEKDLGLIPLERRHIVKSSAYCSYLKSCMHWYAAHVGDKTISERYNQMLQNIMQKWGDLPEDQSEFDEFFGYLQQHILAAANI